MTNRSDRAEAVSERGKLFSRLPFATGGKWWALVLLLTLLAGFLRFWNLSESPRWYGDECVEMLLARDFASGRMAWDAWEYRTMMPPYSFSPPLYLQETALFMKIFDRPRQEQLLWYRGWTSLMATASLPALAWLGRIAGGPVTGLAAALIYAVHPVTVVHGRFGFRHNQSMLFNLLFLCFLLLWMRASGNRSQSRKWLLLASLATALSFFCTYRSYVTLLALFLLIFAHVRRYRDWPGLAAALLIALGPGAVMYLPFLIRDGMAFFSNMATDIWQNIASPQAKSLFPKTGITKALSDLNRGFLDLISYDLITLLGLHGLLTGLGRGKRRVVFFFFLAALLTIVNKQNTIRTFFYPVIIIAPLFSLGAAFSLLSLGRGTLKLLGRIRGGALSSRCHYRLAPLYLAFVICLFVSFRQAQGKLEIPLSHLSARDSGDSLRAAQWINSRVGSEELVVAPPTLSWLLNGKRTTLLQATAFATGKCPPYFFQPMPRDRYTYNPSLENAGTIVVGDIDETFTLRMPGVRDYLNMVLAKGDFELAMVIGEFRIYRKKSP